MKSVVIDTPGQVRVETLPDPALPGLDGAVIQVRAAAICGSDLHFYEGDYPLGESVALGHEAVGTIVEDPRRMPRWRRARPTASRWP